MPMAAPVSPPPLRDGDRLTSDEFLARWEAMPELKHAELLDGIVYVPSPLSRVHATSHIRLSGWISSYEASTPGCEAGSDGTWLMGPRDVPQPDIGLRILPNRGGQSRDEGEYTAGAPELIVEVAASSRSRDLGVKRRLYERMGVREYVVALAREKQILWHILTPEGFQSLDPDADRIFRSRCFPGLWLDHAAFWTPDQARVLAVMDQGLATSEHAAFVAQLADMKR